MLKNLQICRSVIFITFLFIAFGLVQANESIKFECDYMSEPLPDDIPVKFSSIVNTFDADEYRITISPKGDEIAFSRGGYILLTRKMDNDSGWTDPVPAFAPFDSEGGEPCFSADGTKLYFCSRRDLPGAKEPLNAWVSKKTDGKWAKPFHLGPPVINQTVHAYSVTPDGSIYCTGITFIEHKDKMYLEVRPLDPPIKGSHPFIAPCESYIIFDKRGENSYASDLYITFKNKENNWTDPINMGPKVNTKKRENNASVSPDGKYLFISRAGDIYWVKADFINDLKKQALGE
ncbi:MAG: hypothetical protein GY865_06375 [candidate division Zixibacteria bacterium]|nr:hypothetical protein [candidate division Zixibacteria bacterium]